MYKSLGKPPWITQGFQFWEVWLDYRATDSKEDRSELDSEINKKNSIDIKCPNSILYANKYSLKGGVGGRS